MRIFVTGATGFVGKAFCEAAVGQGHEVLALTRDAMRGPARCARAVGSLERPPWPEIEAFGPETAVHLAWVATPGNYLHSLENNLLLASSARLFQGLVDRGVCHVVGAGTSIEYAPSDLPLNERDSPLGAMYPYSCAKLEASTRLRVIAESAGARWTWGRIFFGYGPGEHPDRIPTVAFRKLWAGERVELRTPSSVRDYIYIADLVSALLAVVERRIPGCVNLATGAGVALRDLATEIADIAGVSCELIGEADAPAEDPFPVVVADASLLKSFGWEPRYSLRQGLEQLGAMLSGS